MHADFIERDVQLGDRILDAFVRADVSGLSMFSDDNFDAVIYYYRRRMSIVPRITTCPDIPIEIHFGVRCQKLTYRRIWSVA